MYVQICSALGELSDRHLLDCTTAINLEKWPSTVTVYMP